jgi:Holliday junction resolvasome RuvABC DNA-binding subunit
MGNAEAVRWNVHDGATERDWVRAHTALTRLARERAAVVIHSAAIHAKVFSALRHLGFRERDVHAVLAALRADVDLRDAPAEHLLREALRQIRPTP